LISVFHSGWHPTLGAFGIMPKTGIMSCQTQAVFGSVEVCTHMHRFT
jgi:hypothetical protein